MGTVLECLRRPKEARKTEALGSEKYGPCHVGTPKCHMWPLKEFKQENGSDIIKSVSVKQQWGLSLGNRL